MLFRIMVSVMAALVLSVIALSLPAKVSAESYRTIETSSPQEVADAMATKLVRGAANVATGWLELPKQIYYTTKDDGVAKGIFVGPFKGVIMTLVRTVAGVGEFATFFVAYPGFYDPYFDPAYVWQKE